MSSLSIWRARPESQSSALYVHATSGDSNAFSSKQRPVSGRC